MVNIELDRVPCPAEDNVLLKSPNTRVFIGHQEVGDGAGGDLFIASDCVSWIDASGHGFALVYPTIALHGTCRDLSAFPLACIYLMIDGKLPGVTNPQRPAAADDEGNEDDADDESEVNFTEVRFVPPADNGPTLEDLYAAFSRGQSLNPDPNEDQSDDSEDGAEYDCEEGFIEHRNGNDDDDDGGEHGNGNGNSHQFDDDQMN